MAEKGCQELPAFDTGCNITITFKYGLPFGAVRFQQLEFLGISKIGFWFEIPKVPMLKP
jgi:hypothetical protein